MRKRDLRGDMNGKLIALLFLISAVSAAAQLRVEGEISIGPTMTSRDAGDSVEIYGGLIFGSAANLTLLSYGIGEIRATVTPTLSLGPDINREMNLQRFHLPIGVMLTVGDNVRDQYGAINGAVTIGYGMNFGAFADNGTDARAFVNFDLCFGIFERGALKVRYATVLGRYEDRSGANLGFHSLMLVGSTEW